MANVKESSQTLKEPAEITSDQKGTIPSNLAANMNAEEADSIAATLDASVACALDAANTVAHEATATVQIDEVFQHITAFRALIDNEIPESSMLGRSLRAQANAVFNQAFFNLQARYGFAEVYIDAPGDDVEIDNQLDITNVVTHEVLRLQRIL